VGDYTFIGNEVLTKSWFSYAVTSGASTGVVNIRFDCKKLKWLPPLADATTMSIKVGGVDNDFPLVLEKEALEWKTACKPTSFKTKI